MKKVIGIVGVFVLSLSMFFSTTSLEINDIQNISLSELALINTASAEDTFGDNIYGCSTDIWNNGSCSLGGYCYIGGSRSDCSA